MLRRAKDGPPSEELMRLFQRGDLGAFDALWERHSPEVTAFHARILRMAGFAGDSFEQAKDLTSETFIKVMQNRHAWDSERGNFTTWLYTIASNVRVSALRSFKATLGRLFSQLDWAPRTLASKIGTTTGVSTLDRSIDIDAALLQLPPHLRTVVLLKFFEGFTEQEVATILSIPVGTVSTQSARALKLLGKQLSEIVKPP